MLYFGPCDDIMRKIDPDFEKNNPESQEQEQAQDDSEPLREDAEEDLGDNSDPDHIFTNEDGSEKTIVDYLQDRIDQTMSVGELNTILQSLFGKFNTVFLTYDEFYNQDPEELQELVVWDDDDMYTINYEIKDVLEPMIAITDVNIE